MVAYSIVHPPIEGESASIEIRASFPLVVVMNSMIDCNEMSFSWKVSRKLVTCTSVVKVQP